MVVSTRPLQVTLFAGDLGAAQGMTEPSLKLKRKPNPGLFIPHSLLKARPMDDCEIRSHQLLAPLFRNPGFRYDSPA